MTRGGVPPVRVAADWYCALLRCTHCDRTPLEHRWENGHYWCENDPTKWAAKVGCGGAA